MAKVKAEDVHYIAFEGGGGKAAAYIGAMVALLDPAVNALRYRKHPKSGQTVLDPAKIQGISGSSSGSVTAALLASGYTPEEFAEVYVKGFNQKLYDPPLPRLRPKVDLKQATTRASCEEVPTTQTENALLAILSVLDKPGQVLVDALDLPGALESTLLNNIGTYLWTILVDFAPFSGCYSRELIDSLIAHKTLTDEKKEIFGATFAQHFAYHQVRLVLPGVDLETGTFTYFSAETTPDFRVADAVRISMSFPLAFKPVIIPEGKYQGTWVDSGAVNNLPIHAFDARDPSSQARTLNPFMLGFRLRQIKRRPVRNTYEYYDSLIAALLGGSMNSQIASEQERDQLIEIDPESVTVLDFNPGKEALKKVLQNGISSVMKYFTGRDTLTRGYKPIAG